jgi:hypothetical protein
MSTASYTQPTHHQPSRWFLPVAGLALGVAALAMSVVAIATDDVTEISERTVVVEVPVAAGVPAVAVEPPVAPRSRTADPETCGFPRIGAIDRC